MGSKPQKTPEFSHGETVEHSIAGIHRVGLDDEFLAPWTVLDSLDLLGLRHDVPDVPSSSMAISGS